MAKTKTTTRTKSPTHMELGKQYVKARRLDTLYSRGYWHKYKNGYWQTIPDAEIAKDIWGLMEPYETAGLLRPTGTIHKSVMGYVRDYLTIEEGGLDAWPNLINLQNGIFNLSKLELEAHDSAFLMTSQLPFEYDERATSPWWQHYINTTFVDSGTGQTDEGMVRLIQEAIAYSLTTDISYQVMFWCVGEGENGKGVLFHVLDRLAGESATPLDLNTLGRSARYELATLVSKRIALCSESSSTKNLLEDATIKALVAGDKMQVRQIRREPFILEPQVKLWWAMNRLPSVADTSHGMWRRIVMVPFYRTFDDSSRIRDLKDRLDKELAGIFNWTLEGYARLKAEGHFSYCKQAQEMKDSFQRESNTVRLFTEDCCDIDDRSAVSSLSQVPSSKIYEYYREWAKKFGYKPMSARSFKQEMESLKFFYKRSSSDRCYEGLSISMQKCTKLGLVPSPWQQPLP